MSTVTPNMGLVISTVGSDSGLVWEQNLNASLLTVDQHNHTPGSGNQIPPSGLNINANLPFNNNQATGLQAAVLSPQTSLSTLYGVYSIGVDLYYNDGSGNIIQITSGGAVNATSSGITSGTASASFVSSVLVVKAASTTPANIKGGSVLLGNNTAGSKYLTLQPPNAMAADYSLTLPSVPAATNFIGIDNTGNMSAYAPVAKGITASNIANNTITATQIANNTITATQMANNTVTATQIANGTITTTQISSSAGITPTQMNSLSGPYYQTSSSSGSFTTSSSSFVDVTNLTGLTIPAGIASGRPLKFVFQGSGATPGYIQFIKGANGNDTVFRIVSGASTELVRYNWFDSSGGVTTENRPPTFLNTTIFSNPSGTFKLQVLCNTAGSSVVISGVTMTVYQD